MFTVNFTELTPAVSYARRGSELVFNCTLPFQTPKVSCKNVQFKFNHELLENVNVPILNSQVVQLKIVSTTKANQGFYKCDCKDNSIRSSSSSQAIIYEGILLCPVFYNIQSIFCF